MRTVFGVPLASVCDLLIALAICFGWLYPPIRAIAFFTLCRTSSATLPRIPVIVGGAEIVVRCVVQLPPKRTWSTIGSAGLPSVLRLCAASTHTGQPALHSLRPHCLKSSLRLICKSRCHNRAGLSGLSFSWLTRCKPVEQLETDIERRHPRYAP